MVFLVFLQIARTKLTARKNPLATTRAELARSQTMAPKFGQIKSQLSMRAARSPVKSPLKAHGPVPQILCIIECYQSFFLNGNK
jgi:hypothetical protein